MKIKLAMIISRLSISIKRICQFINERQMLKFLIEHYLLDILEICQMIIDAT